MSHRTPFTIRQPSTDGSFDRALRSFLSLPTVAGWEVLIRSVHPSRRHQAAQEAAIRARAYGTDPTLLFHCLLRSGPTSVLLSLVESGAVEPRAVAAAAQDAPGPIKALWWALAAQAAQARGESSHAELLLHRALRLDPDHSGVRVVMARMARQLTVPQRECA